MAESSINIISNNCVGGFIYRDILCESYKNPFIWTLFDDKPFVSMIKNFDHINFRRYTIRKQSNNWNIHNDFDTIIDDVYRVHNIHMYFDQYARIPMSANGAPPAERHLWTTGVRYAKIWEYISDCYKKRVHRMFQTTSKLVVWWSKYSELSTTIELLDIVTQLNLAAIIFDNRVESSRVESSKNITISA